MMLENGDMDRDEATLLLQNIKRDLLNGGNQYIFNCVSSYFFLEYVSCERRIKY
jgi:hypothetical protein